VGQRRLDRVHDGRLVPLAADGRERPALAVGSAAWYAWLAEPDTTSFAYSGAAGTFTARREERRGRRYWYAYRRQGDQLRKEYLGPPEGLSAERLAAAAARLAPAAQARTPGVGHPRLMAATENAPRPPVYRRAGRCCWQPSSSHRARAPTSSTGRAC